MVRDSHGKQKVINIIRGSRPELAGYKTGANKMPETWGGRSAFIYVGSVEVGTQITYGRGHTVAVTAEQYAVLRRTFMNRIVTVSTSRTNVLDESIGAWLQANVSKTAIASYVAPILILENYAERISAHHIRITR